MSKVLAGLKVVEQGTFITGPAAGHAPRRPRRRRDQGRGARQTGDPFRAFKNGLYSPHFQTYNRNKRSITLDTKDGADRAVLDRLIEGADVYIQNFRPGVADKLGVGESACARSTRSSSTARSAASDRAARPRTGPPTTRSRRRRAAS